MPSFSKQSKEALAKCHPALQEILNEAIKSTDFVVMDSTRGRNAQNRAFATGKSKAKFGSSAHNYMPAIAVDIAPYPVDWNDRGRFYALAGVVMGIAQRREIPLRHGGDWNMDGNNPGDKDNWDLPHYELHPWREWAKKSKLYED